MLHPAPPRRSLSARFASTKAVPAAASRQGSNYKNRFSLTTTEQHKVNMQAVNIPSDSVPENLKPIEQIVKRAKELKLAEPVISYWCCFSAAQKALKMTNRSKEDTIFLMALIEALEAMKVALAANEAITSEAAGAAYVENFALKVFMSADNDDRAGNTGKQVPFHVAGQFIEVLRCFEHGMTEEMEQKLLYARWKAADGAKALREGRVPTAGPPFPEQDHVSSPAAAAVTSPGHSSQLLQSPPQHTPGRGSRQNSFSNNARPPAPSPPTHTQIISPRPSPALNARNNPPPIDTDPRTPRSTTSTTGSGAWSTVATPGLPDDDESQLHFDLNRPDAMLPPPAHSYSGQGGKRSPLRTPVDEKKNVRFLGPDGAPLSPASTHLTVSSYTAPPAPPPTDIPSPEPRPKTLPVVGPPPSGRPRGDSSSSRNGVPHVHSTPNNDAQQAPSGGNGATSGPRQRTAQVPIPGSGSGSGSSQGLTRLPSSGNVPPPPPPSLIGGGAAPRPLVQPQSQGGGLGLSSPPPMQGSVTVLATTRGRSNSHSHAQPQSQPHTSSSPSQPFVPTPKTMSRKDIEYTQKHAKFAISAMEFDDFETARAELRKAINMLGG
ncbi:hypothetical protein L202_06848 [Cryptococcus amylolentus CBS 6039]|uniref:Vta1 C-terminal domain-containing protein n=1 Tax=Cryptococcus amylolentus CBS 6039 TaxID=1295533 RepID=A0A1E3HDP7_9TREE|nr:hypothetical protein L202_06848 [Cryptococcus amylolentus CBS 6039]ODN74462.1 hypothetical protein L202_06848 [Cryptococcus amylolentus CBS 6039]